MLGGFGLSAVDGQVVFLPDLQCPVDVPALVQVREPFGNVFVALLVAVDAGGGQREAQEVGCELLSGYRTGGAEAAVVGLGAGDDVFYVGLLGACEPCPGIGSVDAALGRDDAGFN